MSKIMPFPARPVTGPRPLRFAQVFCIFLVMTACSGAEKRLEPSKWEMEPIFTIPRLPGGARTDAVLADNEWEGATSISAVFDASTFTQSVQPVMFRLCWRDQALHLAFKMRRPKGCRFPRITDKTKGYTTKSLFQRDDNLEVWLAPTTKGVVASGMMKPQYAIAANAGGAYCHVMTGYPRDKIPRDLEYATYFDYNTGEWQGELKFPWSIFEVMDIPDKKPPADGTEWKGVIFFHQVTPSKNYLAIQPKLKIHPTLRFSEKPIGFSISALELAGEGRAVFEVAVNNQSPKPAAYELSYEVFKRNKVPRSKDEEFLTVWEQIERIKRLGPKKAAVKGKEIQYIKTVQDVENELNEVYAWVDGGIREIKAEPGRKTACTVTFDSPDGYYVLRYDLKDKETGRTVMRQVIPACLSTMSVEVKPEFLLKKVLVVRANVSGLHDLAKGDPIDFCLKEKDGGEVERRRIRWDGTDHIVTCLLPTAKTAEGREYTITVRAVHEGKPPAEVSESVRRPPTPEWFGNTLGTSKKIPWGYKPIKRSDDGFEVVFRKYVMNGRPLPEQIISRGDPLLAGPMELSGEVGGRPISFEYGKFIVKDTSDTRAVFEQEVRADGLLLKVRGALDFDGFIRYDLALKLSGAAVRIDKLLLRIPVNAKYVKYYAHKALSTDLAGYPSPAYPYGAVEDFFENNPGGWIPFTYAVYLGCRDRGIEWVAESDRYWSPENEGKMIRLAKEDGRVDMVFQFIGRPTELKAPRTISFGIIATPVREYTRRRYYSRFKTALSFQRDCDWKRFDKTLGDFCKMGFNYFNLYINAKRLNLFSNARYYDKETLGTFREYARRVHERGGKLIYYCGYGLPHGIPNDDTFGSEMRMEPVKPSGWYNHAGPFADYWLHSVKFMCDNCNLDGIQTDGLAVVPLMTNPSYDFGWSRNGKQHGTYPVFAVRELMKRLYIMLKFELDGGKEGYHTLHCDRPPVYSIDAWSDYALSGEAHHHTVTSLRELFPDRYAVFYDTLGQGVAPYALWGYARDLAVTRNMAFTLHHLHGIQTGYAARLGKLGPAYEVAGGFASEARMWHDFNMGEADYRPYWKHPDLVRIESNDPEVEIPDDAIRVTAFVHPGESALLVVANLDHVGYTLRLSPDLQKLDLPGGLQRYYVSDPILEYPILTRPSLRIDVYPQRWRAILIRKRK